MKTNQAQQEILLFTHTRFCRRIGNEALNTGQAITGSACEMLEDACWKGIIPRILPEITRQSDSLGLSLWEINRAASFLDLQYADAPRRLESELSVNPYLFLGNHRLN